MIKETDIRILLSMIKECDHLTEICDKYNDVEIVNSFIYSDSIQYEFEKLFEDITRLSTELQEDPSLHLKELRGIRNRIAHNYESVSITILLDTIRKDVPVLRSVLKNYLELDK